MIVSEKGVSMALKMRYRIFMQTGSINSIFINTDMKLFAVSSNDGSAQVYNYITSKPIKFIHLSSPLSNALLVYNPIPSIILHSYTNHLYSYSLNTQLLATVSLDH